MATHGKIAASFELMQLVYCHMMPMEANPHHGDIMTGKTRVQLEMPQRSMERLRSLRDKTEAVSYAEVIRNALQLYEAAVVAKDEGGSVIVRRKDGTEALAL